MTALLLYVACCHGRRPTGTPDGSVVCLCSISSTSLSDRDQEIRELRQQVQDLTGVLEAISLTQRQISDHETRADWYSQHWKSWQDGWWHDQRWTQNSCSGQLVGRCEIIVEFLAGSGSLDCSLWFSFSNVAHFRTSHVFWVLRKLSDVEEGCSEEEDDPGSPCGETGTKVMNSLD